MLRAIARKILATQPAPVQAAARNLVNELRMARAIRHSSRQFKLLGNKKGLKVHLGCGPEFKSGWVNVDLILQPVPAGLAADTMCIRYDLRSGTLPLDNESCVLFYSSHFMEHMEYEDGVRLMRDCYRALQPGGIFRAGLPHFRKMFRAYLDADERYFDLIDLRQWLPGRPAETYSLVDHVNLGVYQWGEHKCVYDEEKICLLLRHIGFSSADIVPYQEGLDPGSELRQRYSFYVQAVK